MSTHPPRVQGNCLRGSLPYFSLMIEVAVQTPTQHSPAPSQLSQRPSTNMRRRMPKMEKSQYREDPHYCPGTECYWTLRCRGPSVYALPETASWHRAERRRTEIPVSYTHLRAHETRHDLVCRLLLEKVLVRSYTCAYLDRLYFVTAVPGTYCGTTPCRNTVVQLCS